MPTAEAGSTTHQIGQDDFEWQVVARCVQKHSSMGKPGEVRDGRLIDICLLKEKTRKILVFSDSCTALVYVNRVSVFLCSALADTNI